MTTVRWWDALGDDELQARLEQHVGPVPADTIHELVTLRDSDPDVRTYLDQVLT